MRTPKSNRKHVMTIVLQSSIIVTHRTKLFVGPCVQMLRYMANGIWWTDWTVTYVLPVDRCMHLYLMPTHCIWMPGICVRGIDFASFCKFTIGFRCDTFNNISAISWRWVLSVEEDGVRGKKTPICRKSMTNFITKWRIE